MISVFSYEKYLIVSLLLITVIGCRKDDQDDDNYLQAPICTSDFIPVSRQFRVVGFYPSWRHLSLPVEKIPWDKLTRVVYAFAVPNIDGTIDAKDLTMVNQLRDSAHHHGVEVYFSVGGGAGSNNFAFIARTETARKKFVNEVCQYVFENCLDGVDIDWEYWSGYRNNTVDLAESGAFVNIIQMLREKLEPFNIGISIDVGGSQWSGKHFMDAVVNSVDAVQVMCYDFTGPWSEPGPHSSFEESIGSGNTGSSTGLAYWINFRRWPKEKILLGIPFYGRDFDNQGGEWITFSEIISLSPDAYLNDRVNNVYYNGIVTMSRKAQYVVDNQLSGIMIWEIGQDSRVDSTSLLNAIDLIINP
jgi:GH18 family chitinase